MIKVVESMARVNGQSVLAIDFDRHEVVYRTENLLYMDEASINDVRRECSNPYWSIITDETLRKLLAIRSNYLLAGEGMSMDDYSGHVCTIDYPITVRGRDLYIAQKFTPLKMRNDGITRLGVFVIGPSSKREMESVVIAPSGRRFRFDFELEKFVEFDVGKMLTSAEKIVLNRARMGMTCEEIASR